MPLVDDLFAFGDDYAEPQLEKKKKKKRKKVKHKKEDGTPVIKKQKESTINDPFIVSFDKNDNESDTGDISIVESTEGVKEEAALTSLLGLSAAAPISSPSKSQSTNPVPKNITDSEEEFSSLMDCETRMTNTHAQPAVTDIDNKPDEFLTSINSYVSEMKEKDSELQDLLQSYRQEDIIIGGISYAPKLVKFEFHIDIQAAGQISGSYDLQVKGSTKLGKIMNTLMPLFNNDAKPQFPQEEWDSLVLYVKDLNIILNSSLKCMSLLGYKNHLKRSNTAQFEVFGIITTEDNAKLLHSNETARKSREDAAKAKIEKPTIAKGIEDEDEDEDEYAIINITIEDPQKKELGNTSGIIDLDSGLDSEADANNTNKPEQVSSLVLSLIQSMTVAELASMYKYKSSLPSELKTELKKDGTILDPIKRLRELNLENQQVLTISYKPEELAELRSEQANHAEDEDDIDDDIDEIRPDNGDFENEDNDDQGQYFSIFVAGKDKKRFKVSVKPSTKISDISKFYLEKAGLPLTTKIKLVFDDDDLDMEGIVGDTELEDEFMVDVVLK